ncbi:MAG TPA: hypothetical protein VMW47_12240 [Verrucomicrobiae bacterium]|nr:hypothetical protein [Verrucomicrobiae bacterium]
MDPQIDEQQEVVTRSRTPTPQGEVATQSVYRRGASRPAGFRGQQLVWLLLGLVDSVLALDFLFRALGAGHAGFVSFVGTTGGSLSAPFAGIVSGTANGHALRWAEIVAIIVWTLAAWFLVRGIAIASAPRLSPNHTV